MAGILCLWGGIFASRGNGFDLVFFEGTDSMGVVAVGGNGVFGLGDGDDDSGSFLIFGIDVRNFVEGRIRDADIFHNFLFLYYSPEIILLGGNIFNFQGIIDSGREFGSYFGTPHEAMRPESFYKFEFSWG